VPAGAGGAKPEIQDLAGQTISTTIGHFEKLEFSKGIEAIWALLAAIDKYIVEQAPWKLNKSPEAADQRQLDITLYTAADVLRITTALLAPVIPESASKIWKQLGMPEPVEQVRLGALAWGQLAPGQQVEDAEPVFPRIKADQAINKMRSLEVAETARQNALLGRQPAEESGGKISIDEFAKVELRVAQVVSAERVKKADKLLLLTVDAGEAEPRTLIAGIAAAYTPEELIGQKVIIVANLQPRNLRGIQSNGMVVAATPKDGKPVLVTPSADVPVGTRLG
jgi:methionyl-tRNA synthetase